MSKYHRDIRGTSVDVYDVLVAFDVTCPAIQHAVKKLLAPGQRGHKSRMEDLSEAGQSIDRAMQIERDRWAAERATWVPFGRNAAQGSRQPTPGVHEAHRQRHIDCDDAPVSVRWEE